MNLDFRRPRPRIQIDLDRPSLHTFTTGDHINGTATLTVDHELQFDDLEITFEGTTKTSVERASIPGQTGAFQTFLKLRQPVDGQAYPPGKTLQAGSTYKFPFTFVVPERLLPQACGHSKKHGHIERAHTLLPPSLGDAIDNVTTSMTTTTTTTTTATTGKDRGKPKKKVARDDMAPSMCRVSYCVRATLVKKVETEGSRHRRRKTLATMIRKVRIIPAVEEEPPLSLDDNAGGGGGGGGGGGDGDKAFDGYYCLRKEKIVRRGWTRARRGRLVVTAEQPKPIEVRHSTGDSNDNDNDNDVVSAPVVTLQLRFDPADNNRHEQPPSLATVCPKLSAATYFSAHPWADFPTPLRSGSWAQLGRGMYMETAPLSVHCAASAPWTKHHAQVSPGEKDSVRLTSSSSSPGCSSGKPFYTASVVIPLTPPTHKTLVPTFHSCLISRVYYLELSVAYNTGTTKKSFLGSTVSLRVPIQVTSPAGERSYKHLDSLALALDQPRTGTGTDTGTGRGADIMGETDAEAEMDADVEAFFTPRSMSRIAQMQMQPPPAYADYRPRVSNGYCLQTVCA